MEEDEYGLNTLCQSQTTNKKYSYKGLFNQLLQVKRLKNGSFKYLLIGWLGKG